MKSCMPFVPRSSAFLKTQPSSVSTSLSSRQDSTRAPRPNSPQTPIRDRLLQLRFPRFLADVLSSTAVFGVKQILGALPYGPLSTTLKVMIPLVCPDLAVCPARAEAFKTYGSPTLDDQLRTIAASTG